MFFSLVLRTHGGSEGGTGRVAPVLGSLSCRASSHGPALTSNKFLAAFCFIPPSVLCQIFRVGGIRDGPDGAQEAPRGLKSPAGGMVLTSPLGRVGTLSQDDRSSDLTPWPPQCLFLSPSVAQGSSWAHDPVPIWSRAAGETGLEHTSSRTK